MTNYISRGGYWNNSLAWDPHGTPGSGDTATIGGQTVIIHSDAEAASTSVDGGSLIFQNGGNLHSSVSGGSVVVDAYATAYLHDINTLGSITVGANAVFTIGTSILSSSSVDLANGSTLKLATEGKGTLLGKASLQSASLILGHSASFGGGYFPSKLTMSDSALNVVKASGAGVVLTNYEAIAGAGTMGGGTLSFVNGDANRVNKASIIATGEDNALVFELGTEQSLKNVNGVIRAAGAAGLIVRADDVARGGGKLINNSTMQVVGHSRLEVSHVSVVNKGAGAADKAVIEATDLGNLIFDTVNAQNTDGEILASSRGTIQLKDTSIEGGALTLDGANTAVIATGQNVLRDVDFNGTGAVFVNSGSLLNVAGAGNSTIGAARIDNGGRLVFGHDVAFQGKGKVVVTGEFGSSGTLTNVDEQVSGAGSLKVANLVNRKGASISGSLAIEIGSGTANTGKLTNAGTISAGKIKAQEVANTGTISNVVFNVPYSPTAETNIDNDGVINASAFGRTYVLGTGTIQADGAGQVTSFAGTKLHGGTLSSSDGGKIVVKAATDPTLLDPDKIAAGTSIALADGATMELDGTGAINKVSIELGGKNQATTLDLVNPDVTLNGGAAITLSDSNNNTLLISKLTNVAGTISGAGEITEAAPEVNSLLINKAGGLVEAKGRNDLTIDIDRLINDGILEADDSILTIHVDGTIGGSGEAFVTNGGTIDMSEVRQYLGTFRYSGQGTILGPDLVPAGTISGFATGDSYVFGKTNTLSNKFTTAWTENAAGTGGTLTILAGAGQAYAILSFTGSYSSDDFAVTQVALQDGNHVALSFVGSLKWSEAVDGNWTNASMWDPTGLYVPGAGDRALIAAVDTGNPDGTYRVAVTQDTTVKSVSTGTRGATLDVKNGNFTVLDGSYTTANAGTVRATGTGALAIGGVFTQAASGRIVTGGTGTLIIAKDGAISGGRIVNNAGGTWSTAGGKASLTGVNVENYGQMDLVKTDLTLTDTRVFGHGSIDVGQGSTLALANSTILYNTVSLTGTVRADTDTTVRTSIVMDGTGRIVSNGVPVTLTNDGTIAGGGRIGDGTMKLVNRSSITAAAGKTLTIATGDNPVVNQGHMFAMAGATLAFGSEFRSRGGLLASNGTIRFTDDVTNSGTMQVDGGGALLDYRGGLVNSGAVSATDGGTIRFDKLVVQKKGGELLASGQGSGILFDSGSSLTGGLIHLDENAALRVAAGGQASLHDVTMTLDGSSDIVVDNASLVLTDARIGADKSSQISVVNANAYVLMTNSSVDGGRIDVARGKLLVDGIVMLTSGTQTSLDNGSILGDGPGATLKNGGFLSGSGNSRIAGKALSLVNEGAITTAASTGASMAIDTGTNAVVNSGTISASIAGSRVVIAGQANNQKSGNILSGSGTVQIGNLDNLGAVKATGVGAVGIAGAVVNDGGVIQASGGGTIVAAATVSNMSGTIQAIGQNSTIAMTAVGLQNDGTIEAKAGGSIDMLVEVNRGKLLATGENSALNIEFTSTGQGNKSRIAADEGAMVTIDGSVTNAGGARLVAADGGEVEVHGAVKGGIAVLSGDDSIMDLQGSATEDTTAQVSFADNGIAHLLLGHSSRFAGTVAGLGAKDTIDVTDVGFVAGKSYYDEANDQLVIGDGTHTATIQLLGQYAASQFAFSSDGHGGTLVTAQALPAQTTADLGTLLAAHA